MNAIEHWPVARPQDFKIKYGGLTLLEVGLFTKGTCVLSPSLEKERKASMNYCDQTHFRKNYTIHISVDCFSTSVFGVISTVIKISNYITAGRIKHINESRIKLQSNLRTIK